MRHEYYILDENHVAVPVDQITWARMFSKTSDRIVGKTATGDGDVSTVFLGLDHAYGEGPPLLFETLVFGGPLDQEMVRYSTYEQAEQGHTAMVERVKGYAQSLRDNAP